jgi:hypothetical protein
MKMKTIPREQNVDTINIYCVINKGKKTGKESRRGRQRRRKKDDEIQHAV